MVDGAAGLLHDEAGQLLAALDSPIVRYGDVQAALGDARSPAQLCLDLPLRRGSASQVFVFTKIDQAWRGCWRPRM